MTSAEKGMLSVLAACAVCLPLLFGLSLEWSAWLWVPLAVVLLVLVWVTHNLLDNGVRVPAHPTFSPPTQSYPVAEPPPPAPEPEPVPYEQTSFKDVSLPSAVADYEFTLSGTVWWRPGNNPNRAAHASLAALAIDAVVNRARPVVASAPPSQYSLMQHRLNGILGLEQPDPADMLQVSASQLSLQISDEDRQRLRALAKVRKDEEVWEHQRNYEINKRNYLREDVLRDTGHAIVWWLSKKDEDIQGTVDLIGPLAQLSASAHNRAVEPLFQPFLAAPDGEHRLVSSHTIFSSSDSDTANDGAPAPNTPSRNVAEIFRELATAASVAPSSPKYELLAERTTSSLRAAGASEAAAAMQQRHNTLDHQPASPTAPRAESAGPSEQAPLGLPITQAASDTGPPRGSVVADPAVTSVMPTRTTVDEPTETPPAVGAPETRTVTGGAPDDTIIGAGATFPAAPWPTKAPADRDNGGHTPDGDRSPPPF